jgi:hypothetical protein
VDAGVADRNVNEIAQYRAIHRGAVFSLIFGLLAPFTFANLNFLVAGCLAIVAGIWALRTIRRFPDIYTGATLAKAGIVLGLIFSLSPITVAFTQQQIITREAEGFARQYAEVLATRDLGGALWHRISPTQRKAVTPADVLAKYEQEASENPMRPMVIFAPYQSIHSLLSEEGASIQFVRVEQAKLFDITPSAAVLLRVDVPQSTIEAYKQAHPNWNEEPEHDHEEAAAHDHDLDDHDDSKAEAGDSKAGESKSPKADSAKSDSANSETSKSELAKNATTAVQSAEAPGVESKKTPTESAVSEAGRNPVLETLLKGPPESIEQLYIMLDLRAVSEGGRNRWYLNEMIFPYKPNTAQLESLRKGTQHGDHMH